MKILVKTLMIVLMTPTLSLAEGGGSGAEGGCVKCIEKWFDKYEEENRKDPSYEQRLEEFTPWGPWENYFVRKNEMVEILKPYAEIILGYSFFMQWHESTMSLNYAHPMKYENIRLAIQKIFDQPNFILRVFRDSELKSEGLEFEEPDGTPRVFVNVRSIFTTPKEVADDSRLYVNYDQLQETLKKYSSFQIAILLYHEIAMLMGQDDREKRVSYDFYRRIKRARESIKLKQEIELVYGINSNNTCGDFSDGRFSISAPSNGESGAVMMARMLHFLATVDDFGILYEDMQRYMENGRACFVLTTRAYCSRGNLLLSLSGKTDEVSEDLRAVLRSTDNEMVPGTSRRICKVEKKVSPYTKYYFRMNQRSEMQLESIDDEFEYGNEPEFLMFRRQAFEDIFGN